MKALMCFAAAVAVLAAPAAAQDRYDRKLEQAVMEIVAKKIGEIRGGFSFDQRVEFVVPQDATTTGAIEVERTVQLGVRPAPAEGLTRAVERQAAGTIF